MHKRKKMTRTHAHAETIKPYFLKIRVEGSPKPVSPRKENPKSVHFKIKMLQVPGERLAPLDVCITPLVYLVYLPFSTVESFELQDNQTINVI